MVIDRRIQFACPKSDLKIKVEVHWITKILGGGIVSRETRIPKVRRRIELARDIGGIMVRRCNIVFINSRGGCAVQVCIWGRVSVGAVSTTAMAVVMNGYNMIKYNKKNE
jgi:hypothetical protein